MLEKKFLISNEAKIKLPRLPFLKIKEAVLGADYDLSLVFAKSRKLAELNKKYRGKNGPTDVLSFPISKQSGEIYISMHEADAQTALFGYDKNRGTSRGKKRTDKYPNELEKFVGFLFIHGLLHLKGYVHGSTMEQEEKKLVKKFQLSPLSAQKSGAPASNKTKKSTNGKKNRGRHRHWNVSNKNSRRRSRGK